MSVHEYLIKDKEYHLIEQEYNGIRYAYISNIDHDNILAIMKYTLPNEIQKEFENKYKCYSTFYIWTGHDKFKDNYHIIISLAQDNLNWSQRELYRVVAKDIDICINKFIHMITSKRFIDKTIRGLNGTPAELPITEIIE